MSPRRPARGPISGTTLRASEIGTFLYCRRAWWYDRRGAPAASTTAIESGLAWHRRHGRRVLLAWAARGIGWLLILCGIAAAGAAVASGLVG